LPQPERCIYDGVPGGSPTTRTILPFSMTAPDAPGTYYLSFDLAQNPAGCSLGAWASTNAASPGRHIAAIVVTDPNSGEGGRERMVTITPRTNQIGTATITVIVANANSATASNSFRVTVSRTQFVNGDFETGDFSGWDRRDAPLPSANVAVPLMVRPTGYPPGSGFFSVSGFGMNSKYSATHGFVGRNRGRIQIAQDVFITPSNPILRFDFRAGWDMSNSGETEPRTFSVTVEPRGGGAGLRVFKFLTALPG